jgi:Heavy metal binding domain
LICINALAVGRIHPVLLFGLGSGGMDQRSSAGLVYTCPVHSDVRQLNAGKCRKCGMALLPEGARFGLLGQIFSSPLHLGIVTALMVGLMMATMMMVRV